MKEIETMLIKKHKYFWNEIEPEEQAEIKALKNYIDYIKENIQPFKAGNNQYKQTLNLFMRKHLDYLEEAFLSLTLGNYNATTASIRTIIENYVGFMLIKKNKKKEIWKDWILWSYNKSIKTIKSAPYCTRNKYQELEKLYEEAYTQFGISQNDLPTTEPYGWLKIVYKLNSYKLKNACDQIDPIIYQDFTYYSTLVHNNDIISKIKWMDTTMLTKMILFIYEYTHKIVKEYNYHITTRNEYFFLTITLEQTIRACVNE